MPIVSSLHYLFGPLIAASALGIIALICRWVFNTDDRDARAAKKLEKVLASRDYGLLVTVAKVRTRDDAEMLQAVLREGGVRASISAVEEDLEVLVFQRDADAARRLVSS